MQTQKYPISRSIQGQNASYLIKWFFYTRDRKTVLVDFESTEFVKLLFVFDTLAEVMNSEVLFQEGLDIVPLDFLKTLDPLLETPTDQFLLTFQVPLDAMRAILMTNQCACDDSTCSVSDESF